MSPVAFLSAPLWRHPTEEPNRSNTRRSFRSCSSQRCSLSSSSSSGSIWNTPHDSFGCCWMCWSSSLVVLRRRLGKALINHR
ncbi:hypothetical protein BDW62DRAFT_179415 [Aspergillus aurantiobrunneus]